MNMQQWAERILSATTLEEKLLSPEILTDENPGLPIFWDTPARPPGMHFQTCSEKLPKFNNHHTDDNRAACLHRFAGHELLAVEIMAYTLLAFPDAPKNFRKGLAHTLREEQEHVRLYMNRLEKMGVKFGDIPLHKHFWAHTPFIKSPLHFVSMMNLTFEQANLDFAPMYGASFARNGDQESATLMARILQDEVAHVRFGWRWLQNLKSPNKSEWDAWTDVLDETLLNPKNARSFTPNVASRKEAGLPEEWIDNLK